MKFIKILLMCFLLSACSLFSSDKSLDDIFNDTSASNAIKNNYSTYVDYYCPSDIHEVDADKISTVFELNDSKIIFNVNVAGIINSHYYVEESLNDDGFFDEDKLVYSKVATYNDRDNNVVDFFFKMYKYDEYYLMHLENREINIYAYCVEDEISLMAQKIFTLLKSSEVDHDKVLSIYSSRDVIEYHKSTVNLFETVMPVEGRIDDMMINGQEAVSEN